jgi:regulatory protein munI
MTTTIQKAFGACVRQFRTNTGLSQEKFALKINMDRTYFASVESGRRNISIENKKKIADGLDLSLSELFSAVDEYKEG